MTRSGVTRDSVVLAGGSVLQMVVALVTVPAYLTTVGESRFGIFVIVLLLLGYFGIIDRAIGAGVTTEIAKLAPDDERSRSSLVWTASVLALGVGLVGGVALLVVGRFVLGDLVSTTQELRTESLDALPTMALCLPLLTVTAAFHGALSGGDHFLAVSVLDTVRVSAMQVLPLLFVVWQEASLEWLAVGVLASVVISGAAVVATCLRAGLAPTPISLERRRAAELFHFGKWISASAVVSPLLDVTDRIAIGAIKGSTAVTVYSVPYNLAQRLSIAAMSLVRAVFPRFSALAGNGARALGVLSVAGLASVTAPAAVLGATLTAPFLEWWIGGDLATESAPVGAILFAGVWINGIGTVPNVLLQAQGRPDLVARLHALELVPFLAVLVLAVAVAGPVGAAVAWTARVLVDTSLLLHLSELPWYRDSRLLVLGGLVLVGAWNGVVFAETFEVLIPLGLALAVTTSAAAWLLAPPEVREPALAALRLRPGGEGEGEGEGPPLTDVSAEHPPETVDRSPSPPARP